MRELAAYSGLALTIGIAAARPRVGLRLRMGSTTAGLLGIAVLLLARVVTPHEIVAALATLWRPLVSIVAMMVLTAATHQLGLLEVLATRALGEARGGGAALLTRVFVLAAIASSVLSNDAAVLLLTPLVVLHVRRRFPGQPALVVPFAFAVFTAAGVAPLVVSNPMNLIVASFAGIGFNAYAVAMAPLWLLGSATTLVMLRIVFARELAEASEPPAGSGRTPCASRSSRARLSPEQRRALGVFAALLAGYPIASLLGGPVWLVVGSGALAMSLLAIRTGRATASELLGRSVSWDVLVFLLAVFVAALGMRNVGVVDHLGALYARLGPASVGVVSAVGSAVFNNHPMAVLNAFTLGDGGSMGKTAVFAALVGGDLGPRFLPTGSLAGLLWLGALARMGVHVPLRRFAYVGAAVTLPTLLAVLLLLHATS